MGEASVTPVTYSYKGTGDLVSSASLRTTSLQSECVVFERRKGQMAGILPPHSALPSTANWLGSNCLGWFRWALKSLPTLPLQIPVSFTPQGSLHGPLSPLCASILPVSLCPLLEETRGDVSLKKVPPLGYGVPTTLLISTCNLRFDQ